ncbi:MAG: hydrolase [Parolsenella sp.]|uniref:hydrolase n=1 Tax=Parolsenella sp. TaxID=2083006 RepID=UPI002E7A09AB|nr:hydrolase [Parolsenella sp.]MEE1372574.1 hydrolase [Parolsenella sp.]
MVPTPEEAFELLERYNQDPFHLTHGRIVGEVLRWYAADMGHADEADLWQTVGILHDLDFERWPEEHCVREEQLMREAGIDELVIRACCSHGWGLTGTPYEPESDLEKILFAADELTGLIGAAVLMRPSKSVDDLTVKSLKKKFKDKKFAAGCSRDVIQQGADRLGWDLATLMEKTIEAMRHSPSAPHGDEATGTDAADAPADAVAAAPAQHAGSAAPTRSVASSATQA